MQEGKRTLRLTMGQGQACVMPGVASRSALKPCSARSSARKSTNTRCCSSWQRMPGFSLLAQLMHVRLHCTARTGYIKNLLPLLRPRAHVS